MERTIEDITANMGGEKCPKFELKHVKYNYLICQSEIWSCMERALNLS